MISTNTARANNVMPTLRFFCGLCPVPLLFDTMIYRPNRAVVAVEKLRDSKEGELLVFLEIFDHGF